jgi:hypothetical protein
MTFKPVQRRTEILLKRDSAKLFRRSLSTSPDARYDCRNTCSGSPRSVHLRPLIVLSQLRGGASLEDREPRHFGG